MKISIVVPVYLSEKFLNENYNNLSKQTYKNIEIIYVNDGSPDNSAAMLNEFARHDNRIKVVHQENAGAAEAVNVGIQNATGDFLMFLDADDWIEQNTCEVALKTILEQNVDMVFWLNTKEYAQKSEPVIPFYKNSKEFRDQEMISLRIRMMGLTREQLSRPTTTDAFIAAWAKIYRASIIKDSRLKWTDTKYVGSSDVLFNNQLMPLINSAYYLDAYMHHYNRNNPNSLTKTYNETLYQKFSNLFKELREVIEVNYANTIDYDMFLEALNSRIALSTINIGLGYVSKGMTIEGYKKFKKFITTDVYGKALAKFKTQYLPIHFRIFFVCCKYRLLIPAYFLLFLMHKLR